jgi:cysteinyl-tRNA synthetase
MKLYNTLTKKKEELKTQKKGVVSIYNCGPTVYNTPTIGNLRTYINVDVLRRALILAGYKVKEAMNITDIEDKIIRDANKQKIKYQELTSKYEKIFLENLEELNIEMPEYLPRATEEIPEMIKIIEKLLKSGYAYKSDDGSVYFSIGKFKNYGKLSGLDKREVKAGARVAQDEYDKENAQDFALWKAKKEGEPSWKAPFGEGRPGWHIECTAMSTKYLGKTIDIHAGGVDLIFPHHENEIAQSEAYTGKKFVGSWFHGEHLLINGERMGKSLNNFYTLDDLAKKFEVEPLAFRMLCLSSHYRDKLNFTDKSIQDAQNALNHLREFMLRLKLKEGEGESSSLIKSAKKTEENFIKAVADDLSTPKAVAEVFKLIKKVNSAKKLSRPEVDAVIQAMKQFDSILGLGLEEVKVVKVPAEMHKLAVAREDARKAGDYKKADELRTKIEKSGYAIEDSPEGPLIRKK